jgi:hypothetical protein
MQSSSNILGSIGLVLVVVLSVIAIFIWLRSRRSKSKYHPSIKRSPNRFTSGAKSARKQVAVQKYVKDVGPELRKRYGKQRRYTPAQVKETVNASGNSSRDDCYLLNQSNC